MACLPLTSRHLAVIHHMTGDEFGPGFRCFVQHVEGENATNRYHFAVFSKVIDLAHHFVSTQLPSRSASGIGYTSKNYLDGRNLASYPVHSRYG